VKKSSGILGINQLSLRVNAKVNLGLAVGLSGHQAGGLHPICSYMHSISLSDEVLLRSLSDDKESSYEIRWDRGNGSFEEVDWAIEDDLAYRAHKLIEQHIGHRVPLEMCVQKSIPAGGGLGGGSADAAGVLVGLNMLFQLKLGTDVLMRMAMELGSDVGFFVDPDSIRSADGQSRMVARPAVVEGFGDRVERIHHPHHIGTQISLVIPSFGCHTGKVYRAFDQLVIKDNLHSIQSDRIRSLVASPSLDESMLFNDLASAAEDVAPALMEMRAAIQSLTGRCVHVSGSGSTLFLIGHIEQKKIFELYPECQVINTRLC
jgi:4-diphosphocytidyl-2-C-methyl-D-erythritol kinase